VDFACELLGQPGNLLPGYSNKPQNSNEKGCPQYERKESNGCSILFFHYVGSQNFV